MEDLPNKILSLEEFKDKFTEEKITTAYKRNYEYSTDLLENRLSNARTLYNNSSRSFFSIITVFFGAIAILMSVWGFNQNYESIPEIIKSLTSILNFVTLIIIFIAMYRLISRFGTDFRDAELEMRIIPFILDDKSKNEENKEDEE